MDIFSYFTSDIDSSKIGFDDDEFGDAETGTALSLIADAFEEISDLIKEGNAKGVSFELRLKLFCDARSLVSVLFGSLGIAFKFAEMEYTSKDSSEVLQAYVYVWANNVDPDLYGKGRNSAYLP